jgi:uncharacterized protein YcgI (DUF1989 family)
MPRSSTKLHGVLPANARGRYRSPQPHPLDTLTSGAQAARATPTTTNRPAGGNKTMKVLHDVTARVNSGTAWEMQKGQRCRIAFQSIVDFVVFNRDNLSERFDQARTKANQGKIYLSTGDRLLSKINNTMMTIVEDTFKGTHDLQYGMCSECSYTSRWNLRHLPPWNKLYPECGITCREDLPLWGCYENIMTALQNYPIMPIDIPAPFNIGQHMELDAKGNLQWAVFAKHKELFDENTHIDLRAEMNCLCAASCDPGSGKLGSSKGFYSKPIRVQVFDA